MRNVFVTLVMLGALGGCLIWFSGTSAEPHLGPARAPDRAELPEVEGAVARAERHFFRGEYEEAAEAYRLLVQEAPQDGLAWARLAFATHELGDFEAALELHEKAANFVENRVTSLFKRSCALARLGRFDEAIESLDRAVSAGYGDRTWAEQEPDLDPLRDDDRFGRLLDRMAPPPVGRGPLDFLSGNWVIRDQESGQILGHMSVQRVERGHLFTEHWNIDFGTSGRGMTYLDPADGAWKMLRVDSEGEVQQLEGNYRAGILVMEGERRQFGGRAFPLRIILETKEDGRILRSMQSSEDGGSTWSPASQAVLSRDEPVWMGRGRH